MAICLHKLVNRAAAINPILLQNRTLVTPALVAPIQTDSVITRRIAPATKSQLLNTEAQFLSKNTRSISNTINRLNEQSSNSGPDGGANEEQLNKVYENLREDLPQLFVQPLDYSNCHKEIVFENRIRGKTYHGIVEYVKQLSLLRLYGHFKYAYVKLDVIKMTQHMEDSSIKVRWRISGITGYRIALKMIQFRVWKPQEMIDQHQKVWIEGFSTFYVNNEGLVVRHIADKVIPDQDKQTNPIEKVVEKLGNVPKLALIVKLSADIAPCVV